MSSKTSILAVPFSKLRKKSLLCIGRSVNFNNCCLNTGMFLRFIHCFFNFRGLFSFASYGKKCNYNNG